MLEFFSMQDLYNCITFAYLCIFMSIYLCRDVLAGIIRKGGFSSLYAGWGAVLCRNVPHSIIKVSWCFQHSMHVFTEIADRKFCH